MPKWAATTPRFVSDEVVDRFCLVGPVEAHRQKLRKLAEVGVTQFNIYLMCGEEEQTLESYKREVLPGFRGVEYDSRAGDLSFGFQFLVVSCSYMCGNTLDSNSAQIEFDNHTSGVVSISCSLHD